ncbi:hypothetical protein [Paenibacillus sp. N3.4]|uniref:hypothetical protein n=1 Tax=Paenibacillus sp. N3.4 TaxID=2603222 RepID=UPI0011C73E4E|nr:hypothetical protein [Paenibacillus sp. N3.4]TXK76598.1 hypothetical protein FU659_25085 [Paenibacillus sp. N3.4]
MYINYSHRLLGSMNDTRTNVFKEMEMHAIPVNEIAHRNIPIEARIPVDHVTISQEALDLMKNPPRDHQINASAPTGKNLTDLGRFKQAFEDSENYQLKFGESVYQDPLEKMDQLVELEARYRDNIKQFILGDEQQDQLNKLNDLVSEIKDKIVNGITDEMGIFFKSTDFDISKFKQHLGNIYDSKRQYFKNMSDSHDADWNKYRVFGLSASNVDFLVIW